MKKSFFILGLIVLVCGCNLSVKKTQSHIDSTAVSGNHALIGVSQHKAFINRFYQFDKGNLGYVPNVTLKSEVSIEKEFEKILSLSNKSISADSMEYGRKLFPKSVVDRYFEFDNLDTIFIVSFDRKFISKAKRSDIEYFDYGPLGQFITSFELLTKSSEDDKDYYGYKIWDNKMITTVKTFFHQRQDSLTDRKILERKKVDPKYLYKSEQWIDDDSKILYGFVSFSNQDSTKYTSILYKAINDSIIIENEFDLSPLIIWSLFPSYLKYNDESILLVKFGEPDSDYIVDELIYFNGKNFVQGANNMID
jgi:hypothetical protein